MLKSFLRSSLARKFRIQWKHMKYALNQCSRNSFSGQSWLWALISWKKKKVNMLNMIIIGNNLDASFSFTMSTVTHCDFHIQAAPKSIPLNRSRWEKKKNVLDNVFGEVSFPRYRLLTFFGTPNFALTVTPNSASSRNYSLLGNQLGWQHLTNKQLDENAPNTVLNILFFERLKPWSIYFSIR